MKAIVTFVLLSSAALNANGSIIAHEGFDYNSSATLDGRNGGTGFSNAWLTTDYVYAIATGSLIDPAGVLAGIGNSLHHSGLQPQARRNLNQLLGTSGTTVYVSFLLRQDAIGDFVQADHDFGGLILGGANQPDIFGLDGLYIGRGAFGSLSDKFVLGVAGHGELESGSSVSVVIGETALIVVRLDFLDGVDKATLFVNPILGLPEPIGDALLDIELGMFSQLSITQGNNSIWTTDEIRIATTWGDVAVPELGSMAIWSVLGLIASCKVNRRRSAITHEFWK